MLQLEIVHARRDVDAVAGVEAHAVLRNAAQRVVHRLDPQRDELAAVLDRGVARAIVVRRHARIVDLEQEAGVDDRLVFLVHRVGERGEILLVGRVVPVLVVELEIGRRDRGDERLLRLHAVERRLQVRDVGAHLVVPDIFDRPGADLRLRPHRALRDDGARARRQHHLHVLIGGGEFGGVARGAGGSSPARRSPRGRTAAPAHRPSS